MARELTRIEFISGCKKQASHQLTDQERGEAEFKDRRRDP